MTEWDAANYARRSSLQEAMAAEVLALLELNGNEHILDIGCGDGRVTTRIAQRLSTGSILGIDASRQMIDLALTHQARNVHFQLANAASLPFHNVFDLVVSFNALHWLPDPNPPLQGIRAALKPNGRAQLRLVPDGARKSLETVLEETRKSERWASYYNGFCDPYLHITPEQYAQAAERHGLRVQQLHTASKLWDFLSRPNFFAFGQVTFVEWTRVLPEPEKAGFISEVLDRYEKVAADTPAETNTFKFYQMDITLTRT